jgi:hypothetical protein
MKLLEMIDKVAEAYNWSLNHVMNLRYNELVVLSEAIDAGIGR